MEKIDKALFYTYSEYRKGVLDTLSALKDNLSSPIDFNDIMEYKDIAENLIYDDKINPEINTCKNINNLKKIKEASRLDYIIINNEAIGCLIKYDIETPLKKIDYIIKEEDYVGFCQYKTIKLSTNVITIMHPIVYEYNNVDIISGDNIREVLKNNIFRVHVEFVEISDLDRVINHVKGEQNDR